MFAWCRTLETKCKKCGSWCTSLGCKVQKVRNHCPMWGPQVSNPHSSTLKTEATCFYETLVFIYQTTHSHIPGGLDLSRYTFLAVKWMKDHFPKSCDVSVKHRYLRYKRYWNETCSRVVLDKEVETIRQPSDTPANGTTAPQGIDVFVASESLACRHKTTRRQWSFSWRVSWTPAPVHDHFHSFHLYTQNSPSVC